MKKNKPQWDTEFGELLQETVVEEAAEDTFSHLEIALRTLDPESLELMRAFLEGGKLADLAKVRGVSEDELHRWLLRSKRQLIQNLRTKCKVRQ